MIDIDHPPLEPEIIAPPRIPTPELAISPSATSTVASSAPPDSATKLGAEYNSPAFIKRARTSYGSLFESDYDPFLEEDGTIPGKGRKRTRLSSTWKYSSRSPTPEAEENIEESLVVQPEFVTRPPPAMTDEGCQTIGFDDGGAAEALANFARQSMNIGRDSYTSLNGTTVPKAVPRPEALFESPLNTEEPPTFQVQHIADLQPIDTNQTRPQSPRLQPVSSEFLPQVSPLLSRNALFPANIHSVGGTGASQSLPAQTEATHTNSQSIGAEAEDLYTASPAGIRGEQPEAHVSDLQDLTTNINGIEEPVLEHHFNGEDQYGNWQNSTHLSHHASPYHAADGVVEEVQADRFYVEEGGEEVEQYSHDGFPESHADMVHSHQYPEIDDGLPNQQLPGWGASDIQYPELQDYGIEDHAFTQPPQPRSAAMSRSQSGQSQVVDLTESSDEEGEGLAEVALEEDEEMEDEEEEVLEDEEGSEEEEEEEQPRPDVVRSPYFSQRATIKTEEGIEVEEEASEGEEQYYDDEEDDGADTIDQRFNVPPGQEFYDEEEEEEYESEDEDMEDEPPHRLPVQKEPVFIDLLSSDDEDDDHPPQSKPVSSAPAQHSRSHDSEESVAEEEEEEEEEEESDGEIPYAERDELEIHVANQDHSREESSDEDDEIMENEGEQDDLEEYVDHIEEESSIAAPSERQLAHESTIESGDNQPDTDRRGLGSDLANADNHDQDLPVESGTLEDAIPVEDESPVKVAIPGQFGRSQTSPIKSVFQRLFNFDGAHDESGDEVSYPELLKDEHSPPVVDQEITTHASDVLSQKITKTQLPTPDATQSFGKTVSSETSFTSTTDVPSARLEQFQGSDTTTIKIETGQFEVNLNTSGPVDVDVEMEQIETTVVTNETAKIKLSDYDVEMSQERPRWTVEQPESTKDAASEDRVVEEPIVEQEHATNTAKVEAVGYDQEQGQAADNEKSLQLVEGELFEPETIQEQIDEQIMEEKLALHVEEPDYTTADDVQEQIAEQFAQEEHIMDVAEPESTNPDNIQEQVDEQVMEHEAQAKLDESNPTENELSEELVAVQEPVHDIAENSIAVDSSPPEQTESFEIASKEPEFTVDSPRRSNRRAKPSAIVAHAKDDVRPITPTKNDKLSARTRREPTSPEVVLDTRAPPKGHDASIELALASLESPSKPQHDLRKPPVADLKLRLSRALRTELSEFTALKVLRYHLNQKLDVLAVATTTPEEPQRAKNGPRHYQITLNVTDPSIAPSGVTEIQIFRPYKDALPTIQAGDGLLLRNFQVISVKNRGFGMRSVTDEGSSWAVFKDSGEPEVRGPPVEFGDGEKNHVIALRTWYKTLDAGAMAKINRANGDKTGVGVGKSIAKAS